MNGKIGSLSALLLEENNHHLQYCSHVAKATASTQRASSTLCAIPTRHGNKEPGAFLAVDACLLLDSSPATGSSQMPSPVSPTGSSFSYAPRKGTWEEIFIYSHSPSPPPFLVSLTMNRLRALSSPRWKVLAERTPLLGNWGSAILNAAPFLLTCFVLVWIFNLSH